MRSLCLQCCVQVREHGQRPAALHADQLLQQAVTGLQPALLYPQLLQLPPERRGLALAVGQLLLLLLPKLSLCPPVMRMDKAWGELSLAGRSSSRCLIDRCQKGASCCEMPMRRHILLQTLGVLPLSFAALVPWLRWCCWQGVHLFFSLSMWMLVSTPRELWCGVSCLSSSLLDLGSPIAAQLCLASSSCTCGLSS